MFPQLGIGPDEVAVAHAMLIETALQRMERKRSHGKEFLLGLGLTLEHFYVLPSTFAVGLSSECKATYPKFPAVCDWREQMEAVPTVQRFRATQPPRAPIEHVRKWAQSHPPKH